MGSKIEVDIPKLPALRRKIDALEKYLQDGDPGIMDWGAKDAKKTILEMTGRGVDYNGNAFIQHSPDYALRENKSSSNFLDLSGRMLLAIKTQVLDGFISRVFIQNSSHGGTIGCYNLALVHNEGLRAGRGRGFKMPQRRFFDISKANAGRLILEMKRRFRNGVRRIIAKAAQ